MAQRVAHRPPDAAFAAPPNNGLDGAGEAPRLPANGASRIERNHFLNARPHERTAGRAGYANGFKPKTLMARAGEPAFGVPRARGGGFCPGALEKGARAGQAPDIALAEMYVRGVSTRKATTVLQAPPGPGASIPPARVSRAAEQPDAGLAARRERPPDETPYAFLDARCAREGGQLAGCAVLVAVGITHGGHRRAPGGSVALPEAEAHWRAFPDSLVRRGLKGVKMIVAGAARRALRALAALPAPLATECAAVCRAPRPAQARGPADPGHLQCAGQRRGGAPLAPGD